ncbi:MAG: NUDIX domain-containing protein, partial [Bacilli bacterium]
MKAMQYRDAYEALSETLAEEQHAALAQYKPGNYRTPDGYTADIAIFALCGEPTGERVLKLMLIQRARYDREGNGNIDALKWALPGGFVGANETAFQAAQRELAEETNVTQNVLHHFGTYDTPGRDPRGWVITNAFYAVVSEAVLLQMQAQDDAGAV